jgi:hypothetical protein
MIDQLITYGATALGGLLAGAAISKYLTGRAPAGREAWDKDRKDTNLPPPADRKD